MAVYIGAAWGRMGQQLVFSIVCLAVLGMAGCGSQSSKDETDVAITETDAVDTDAPSDSDGTVDTEVSDTDAPVDTDVPDTDAPVDTEVSDTDAPVDTDIDGDGDGAPASTDCDDGDDTVYPGAIERCDGIDNDCDLLVDDEDDDVDLSTGLAFYDDDDGDGFGDLSTEILACTAPAGFVEDGSDCDDGDDGIFPGAAELCDDIDNDCDATTGEDGQVSFEDAAGDWSDVTALFAGTHSAAARVVADAEGTYWFCDGTYRAHVEATASISLVGRGDGAVLDGAAQDSVLFIDADGLTVTVDRLTLLNGQAQSGILARGATRGAATSSAAGTASCSSETAAWNSVRRRSGAVSPSRNARWRSPPHDSSTTRRTSVGPCSTRAA